MVIGNAIKLSNPAVTPGDGTHTLSEPHIRVASQMEIAKRDMSELAAINKDMANVDAALSALKVQRSLAVKAAEDAESRALAIQRSLRELDLNTHQGEWIDDVRRFALAMAADETTMNHVNAVDAPLVTDDKKGLTKRERVLADFIRAEGFLEAAKEERAAAHRDSRPSTASVVDVSDVTIDSDAIHEGVVQRFKAGNLMRIARRALRQGLARDGVDVATISELQSPTTSQAARAGDRRASTGAELPPVHRSRKSSLELRQPPRLSCSDHTQAPQSLPLAPRPSSGESLVSEDTATGETWKDLNLEAFADFDEVKAHQFRITAFKKKIQDLKKQRSASCL
jgi:hypothetical protein